MDALEKNGPAFMLVVSVPLKGPLTQERAGIRCYRFFVHLS